MSRRQVVNFRPSYLMYSAEAVEAVSAVLRSGRVLQGDVVRRCEQQLQALTGKRYALLYSSATAAIEATMAFDDRGVNTPTVNFVSVPYLARKVRRPLRLYPRTRPLSGPMTGVPDDPAYRNWHVALAGQAGDDYIASVGPDDIEDASQCFMTLTPQGMVGTFGRAGIYSFTFNKFATAGEGGCVVTDDVDLYEHLHRYRDFGRLDHDAMPPQPPISHLGYNHRLSELNAALLLVQLQHADETRHHLTRLHVTYAAELDRVGVPMLVDDHDNHTRVVVAAHDVEAVRRELARRFGIATPTPIMDYSMAQAAGFDGAAEAGWDRLMCLPFWHGLTDDDIACVAESLRAVVATATNRGEA